MAKQTKSKRVKPTSAELELLKILWKIQPASVRQIYDCVSQTQSLAYTSVLKTLQIMHEKGLVTRDESQRAHVYQTQYSQSQTQSSLIKDMVNSVFGGSKFDLVMRALGDATDPKELAEIRELLDKLEQKDK